MQEIKLNTTYVVYTVSNGEVIYDYGKNIWINIYIYIHTITSATPSYTL